MGNKGLKTSKQKKGGKSWEKEKGKKPREPWAKKG